MTTAEKVPVWTGFCNVGRHQTCRGGVNGHPCPCPCHQEPEPEPEPEPPKRPTLVDFLRSRIADDEQVAEHATAAIAVDRTEYAQQLLAHTGPLWAVTSASHCGHDMGPRGSVEATPGRVLAECKAKRLIVDTYVDLEELGGTDRLEQRLTLRFVMESLALAYADHEDYAGAVAG